MLPMLLAIKAVMNPPNLAPTHHPIQPKTIMPMNIQSLFISYPTRIMANDNYTVCIKHKTLSFYNHFQGNFLGRLALPEKIRLAMAVVWFYICISCSYLKGSINEI